LSQETIFGIHCPVPKVNGSFSCGSNHCWEPWSSSRITWKIIWEDVTSWGCYSEQGDVQGVACQYAGSKLPQACQNVNSHRQGTPAQQYTGISVNHQAWFCVVLPQLLFSSTCTMWFVPPHRWWISWRAVTSRIQWKFKRLWKLHHRRSYMWLPEMFW
jgi:hypothetical protein